jgi:hypothetical protein
VAIVGAPLPEREAPTHSEITVRCPSVSGMTSDERLTRRGSLLRLAGLAGVAAGGAGWRAAGSDAAGS